MAEELATSALEAEVDAMISRAEASRERLRLRAEHPAASRAEKTRLRSKIARMDQVVERLRAARQAGRDRTTP